jgi:hypothetical protein
MSFTVVPLHNISLPAGTQIPFGHDFTLQDVPDWVKNAEVLNDLSRHDKQSTMDAKHAFVAEYEAAAIGEPDPAWQGQQPQSIQELKFQSAMLANMALWLRQPTPACFTICFHAISWQAPHSPEKIPIIQQVESHPPLYCHPDDNQNPMSASHIVKAGEIYAAMRSVPRKNAVWEALRFFWAGLTSYQRDFRYTFFWVGLEALFGPNDIGETTYKLCQRIAFFIAKTPEDTRQLFKKAKTCYNTRSKIVHGRWKDDPKFDRVMADTEAITRTSLRLLLESPEMLKTFVSNHRDGFLEDWVFSRSPAPPPFPK